MRSDCKHKAPCGFKSAFHCRYCKGEPWNQKCKRFDKKRAAKEGKTVSYHFRVHTPNLLEEIVNCAMRRKNGVLYVPINQFRILLAQVAERATKIGDTELNCLMIRLGLYNGCEPGQEGHDEIMKYLEQHGEM